jgi:hypothetical protein
MRYAPVSRTGARPAETIAHGRAAGLECTGQAAGIGSRRACQWTVLIAGDPARAGDPAWVHQAMRTRRLLPQVIRREARPGRLPGLENLGARVVPGRAGLRSLGAGQVRAPDPDGGDRDDEGDQHDPC